MRRWMFRAAAGLTVTLTAGVLATPVLAQGQPPQRTHLSIVDKVLARGVAAVSAKDIEACARKLVEPEATLYGTVVKKMLTRPQPNRLATCLMIEPGFTTPIDNESEAFYSAKILRTAPTGTVSQTTMLCHFKVVGGVMTLKNTLYVPPKVDRFKAAACGMPAR